MGSACKVLSTASGTERVWYWYYNFHISFETDPNFKAFLYYALLPEQLIDYFRFRVIGFLFTKM